MKHKSKHPKLSCTQCGICCTLFFINLNEKEWRSGIYKTLVNRRYFQNDFQSAEKYGGTILLKHKNGSCIYQKHHLCSIHNKRPASCRNFFCTSRRKEFQGMIRMIMRERSRDTIASC